MTPRNRASVDVHLLRVEAELLDARDRLRGERLVELGEIDALRREPGACERLLARGDRPEAHVARLDASGGRGDVARLRSQPQLLDRLLARDEDRGGAVVEPRRVPGGHAAVLRERGP